MSARSVRQVPRVRIHKNRNTTVTGVHCSNLKSILTMAVIHAQDELARPEIEADGRAYYKDMLDIIDRLEKTFKIDHARVIRGHSV